jgi:hypothetical protein
LINYRRENFFSEKKQRGSGDVQYMDDMQMTLSCGSEA